jgi:hypothetical protein
VTGQVLFFRVVMIGRRHVQPRRAPRGLGGVSHEQGHRLSITALCESPYEGKLEAGFLPCQSRLDRTVAPFDVRN